MKEWLIKTGIVYIAIPLIRKLMNGQKKHSSKEKLDDAIKMLNKTIKEKK